MSAATSQSGSFVRRRIQVTFQLGGGRGFDGGSADTVTLSGLRCSALVERAGGVSQGALDLRIYGMAQGLMNQLSQVGKAPVNVALGNVVTVTAGTDAGGLSVVYQGTISHAFADYAASPDVAFHVLGVTALDAALRPVPTSSYRGGADVATIMANIAGLMRLKFENNGVAGIVLSNPYFHGTALQQMESCRDAAGIEAHVIDDTLAIWPEGGSRGGAVPLLSPSSGLVGYPVRTPIGVECEILYTPSVAFGAKVKLQSPDVPQCEGVWQVAGLTHILESETPDGAWFTRLSLKPLGFYPR